jgi:hypothetical protein
MTFDKRKSNKYLIYVVAVFFVFLIAVVIFIYSRKPEISASMPLKCEKIIENGNPDNKIDILFIFDSVQESKAEEYVNYLLKTEPFKSKSDSFNFYSLNSVPDCDIKNGILFCYSRKLIRESSVCPNDYIVVLSDKEKRIRSSAYINLMSINTNHAKSVLIHEFGHVFANLADEYVPSIIPFGSKNCVKKCDDFDSETDGCYEGCSKDSRYRSIDKGIMRTLRTDEFGVYDKKIVMEKLEKYE